MANCIYSPEDSFNPCKMEEQDKDPLLNFDIQEEVKMFNNRTIKYTTKITSDFNFIDEFLKYKQYYIDNYTRYVLTEKNK